VRRGQEPWPGGREVNVSGNRVTRARRSNSSVPCPADADDDNAVVLARRNARPTSGVGWPFSVGCPRATGSQHGRSAACPQLVPRGTFWRWWNRCRKRAGVRCRRPHTSRHTYATKLIRNRRPSRRRRRLSDTRRSGRRLTSTRTSRWPMSHGPSRRWKRPAKRSARHDLERLQIVGNKAPGGFEPPYEALQASA
jgi:hypothetical protein